MSLPPKTYIKLVNTLVISAHKTNIWLLMPSLLALVLLGITLRNAFNTTISWSHEVSGMLLLSIFFLDLPYCLSKSEFLKVDILYQYFSTFWKIVTKKLALASCLIVSLFLLWQALIGVRDMLEFDETALTLPIPLWPFSLMVAVSSSLMLMQSLLMLFERAPETE